VTYTPQTWVANTTVVSAARMNYIEAGLTAAAAGGAGALTLLSTTTLASAAQFDVTSISGSYNDLILVLIARSNNTGNTVYFTVNGDNASSNYYSEHTRASGTTLAADQHLATSSWDQLSCPGSGAPANWFGSITLTILGYASTTRVKPFQAEGHVSLGSSTGQTWRETAGGLWNNTAAINRVSINCDFSPNNFAIGSELRIYGRL
jgi:hypothetical protein